MGASRIAIYPVPLSRAAGAAGGVDAVSIVLDVGWGEGLFTRYLTGVAASVVGIDLSETAIARARGSVPQVEFHCVSVQEYAPRQRFDDVVAAGMLYDADDLEQALDSLRALANVIVVSYARARAPQIERRLRHAGHVTSTFHSLFQSKNTDSQSHRSAHERAAAPRRRSATRRAVASARPDCQLRIRCRDPDATVAPVLGRMAGVIAKGVLPRQFGSHREDGLVDEVDSALMRVLQQFGATT